MKNHLPRCCKKKKKELTEQKQRTQKVTWKRAVQVKPCSKIKFWKFRQMVALTVVMAKEFRINDKPYLPILGRNFIKVKYLHIVASTSKVVTSCTGRISYKVRAWMSKNSSILYLEAEKIKLTCFGDRGSLEPQIFKVGSLKEHWIHRTLLRLGLHLQYSSHLSHSKSKSQKVFVDKKNDWINAIYMVYSPFNQPAHFRAKTKNIAKSTIFHQ